jgi:hypothetical protein
VQNFAGVRPHDSERHTGHCAFHCEKRESIHGPRKDPRQSEKISIAVPIPQAGADPLRRVNPNPTRQLGKLLLEIAARLVIVLPMLYVLEKEFRHHKWNILGKVLKMPLAREKVHEQAIRVVGRKDIQRLSLLGREYSRRRFPGKRASRERDSPLHDAGAIVMNVQIKLTIREFGGEIKGKRWLGEVAPTSDVDLPIE